MAKTAGGKNTAGVVETLVRPVVEGMGLSLWDVRFEKEGPDWFLRVLIDRDEPLDTDTCEAVSRAIDPLLDEADPIEQSYYLEVGSPGLGRRLTRPEHYEQLKGQKCAAHLIRPDEQGRRDYAGILQGLDADGNLGRTGLVLTPIRPGCEGRVRVDGVDWRAACSTPLEAGARCRVTAVGATTLTVEPLSVPSHSAT